MGTYVGDAADKDDRQIDENNSSAAVRFKNVFYLINTKQIKDENSPIKTHVVTDFIFNLITLFET